MFSWATGHALEILIVNPHTTIGLCAGQPVCYNGPDWLGTSTGPHGSRSAASVICHSTSGA